MNYSQKLLLFLFLLIGCHNKLCAANKEKIHLKTEVIKSQLHSKKLNFVGTIYQNSLLVNVAESSGQIEKLYFNKGDFVHKDEIIMQIENVVQVHDYEVAQINWQLQSLRYETEQELFDNKLSSAIKMNEIKLQLQNAKQQLESARLSLDKTLIRAKTDGYIDNLYKYQYDIVNNGDKLFDLLDMKALKAVFYVNEEDLEDVYLNQLVYYENQQVGKVDFISKIAQKNKIYRVESTLDNHAMIQFLSVNQHMNLMLPCKQKHIFKIPTSAFLINDQGKMGVKIIDDNRIVKFIDIKEIILQDEQFLYLIFDNYTEHEITLITRGHNNVKDGYQLTIE